MFFLNCKITNMMQLKLGLGLGITNACNSWLFLFWQWNCRRTHRPCQATPLLSTDGVRWGEGGHRGRHWNGDSHPVSLPARRLLLFIYNPDSEGKQWMLTVVRLGETHSVVSARSWQSAHLGAGPAGWTERSCAAPPDREAECRGGRCCVAGAMEPDSGGTACSLCPGWTPLGRHRHTDRQG